MTSPTLRAALLAECDAALTRVLQGHGTEPQRVRAGMQRARDLIATAPEQGAAEPWLRARLVELEALRATLVHDPDDPDGWALGGLRSITDLVAARLARTPAAPRFLPDGAYFAELGRPWKLGTLAIALGLLLWGALVLEISDWDVGVTLIMSALTYLTAPWSVRLIWDALRRRPPRWPLWLLAAGATCWFVVDGAYAAWHGAVGNQMLRDANAWASTPLYLMAGVVWSWRGSVAELIEALRAALAGRR